ncbi:MAG: T9SS type A sorting domain-containing protein [Candidatus Sabulitectum sp.]|nr:T9SS type A sorting domain-containing protein [Candidatus Sabulitectum sp.]
MDFNNDGILDFILGERNGYYNFYTGNGDGTLHFIGRPWDTNGDPIERNYNSSGYLDDWNEDGYIDFIAGGYNVETTGGGIFQVHLNTGDDISSPVWEATVIDLTSTVCNKWRLTHQTHDLDGDGDKDLVLGYEMGNVWFSENIGTNSDPAFNGYTQLVCDGGDINVYTNYSGGGRARENVVDYNSDGVPDLLVGCSNGWIYYFEGYGTGIAEESSIAISEFQMILSEVPTTGMFSVNLTLPSDAVASINVFDATGRLVVSSEALLQSGFGSIQMNITDDPAGMYLVSVSVHGITETARLIKIN